MLGGRSVCAEPAVRPVNRMAQTRSEWIGRGGLVREDKTFMEMNLRAARVKYLANQKKAMIVCVGSVLFLSSDSYQPEASQNLLAGVVPGRKHAEGFYRVWPVTQLSPH
jgi:hypothetical protein